MSDPLSDVLALLRVESALSARLEARGNWALTLPAKHEIVFGVILEGTMLLSVGDNPDCVALAAGDCYLLTRGQPYRIASSPTARAENGRKIFDSALAGDRIVRYGRGELAVVWAGGSFRLNDDSGDILLQFLPPIIHLPSGSLDKAPLRAAFQLIDMETANLKPGANSIAGSLANIVLVQMLRVYLSQSSRPTGWLGALLDDKIGAALALMHADYARHWSVEDLALKVGMSRTAFAVRFRRLVGIPPLEYLTQWRMAIARSALKDGISLSEVAESVGYASDTAFNAAFKRATGQSPGRFRSH